jgi:hypothetical protein
MKYFINIFVVLSFLIIGFSSCEVCKYKYKRSEHAIVSVTNNSITDVYIQDSAWGHAEAIFRVKDGKNTRSFSLLDFSPAYFNCTEGCNFRFEKNKIYYVHILPGGDNTNLPVRITVNNKGEIENK